jgi:hypothetical protein
MNKSTTEPRWYQPWRRPEARALEDPADLGTCFGMEVSLSAQASAVKAVEPPRRLGWVQRLAAKRSRAA